MLSIAIPRLTQPAAAVDIDSDEALLNLIRNPEFRHEFMRFARGSGQRAMYVAVDEADLAIGAIEDPRVGTVATWVHVEARQTCLKDRQNRGVQAECRLLVENDRFVDPGISLSPGKLAAMLQVPALPASEDHQVSHWLQPGIESKPQKRKQKSSIPGEKASIPKKKSSTEASIQVETLSKIDEQYLMRIEDWTRNVTATDVDKQLARLKSIEPVTSLSQKQRQDLVALTRDRRFEKFVGKYLQASQHKAMALALDGDRTATGLVWGEWRTGAMVKQMALAECRKNRIQKKIESGCFIYMLDDRFVFPEAGITPP